MSTAHGLLLGALVVVESAALACLLAELTLRGIGRVPHGDGTQRHDLALGEGRTAVALRHIARSVTGAGRKLITLGRPTPGCACFLSPRPDLREDPVEASSGPADGRAPAVQRVALPLASGRQGRSEGPSRSVATAGLTTERVHARRVTQDGVALIHAEEGHDA